MEAAGMVHALEEIHRLLKPDGCLIDIHPVAEAPLIKVYQEKNLLFTESDPGYDYEVDLYDAEDALKEIVRRGLFLFEGRDEFDLVTYSSSVPDLRDFFAMIGAYSNSPKDDAVTARQAEVYARADEIMRDAVEAEIAYHERADITRLNPNVRG
jgi:SAM-dependent methyltransferase